MSASSLALATLVAIRVAPDVPPELSRAAVRSCEAALGEGQCRLEDPLEPAEFRATITLVEGDAVHVAIEHQPPEAALQAPGGRRPAAQSARTDGGTDSGPRIQARKGGQDPPRTTRDVAFDEEDTPRERWASLGVLVAALVVAARAEERPPPPPEAAPAVPRDAVQPAKPPPPRPTARARVDLRAVIARRLAEGPPEVGAELGGSLLGAGATWFGFGALAAAARPSHEPSALWVAFSVGPGVRLAGADATVAPEIRAGALLEYVAVAASEGARSESGGAVRAGGTVGVDLLFAVQPRWILSAGVEGTAVAPRLRIDVAGRPAERVYELGAIGTLGIRFLP